MMRAMETRIVGLGAILIGVLFGQIGCKPASSGSGKAPPVLNISGEPDGTNPPTAPRPQPVEYLAGFFRSVAEKKCGPDAFTAAFKQKVARPKDQNAQHEKLGFDPDKFTLFLDKATVGTFDNIESVPAGTGTCFASITTKAGKSDSCLIRLVPADDATGWRIDWLHRTSTIAPAYRDASLTPPQNDARIAAIAFLSTMLDGQFDLAEALMTSRYKRDVAWSITPSHSKLGYDPGMLHRWRLGVWKENSVEFTIEKQEIAEGESAVIRGEMIDAGKRNRRPYAMTLLKEVNGEWLVDRFEAK
jgi:hypothetical protein